MSKRKIFKYLCLILIPIFIIYGIFWYLSKPVYPVSFGVSFSKNYAEYLGMDWKETYDAIVRDLKPKYVRLNAAWSDIEKDKNKYDFSDTDYQMNEAAKNNIKVVLVIGQKAPRWPECYIPLWEKGLGVSQRKKDLLDYEKATIEHYKTNPALEIWQVENEPYIPFYFGACDGFNRNLTVDEIQQVKELDPKHKVMITDSGEMSTWYDSAKNGDILGPTLYRTVRLQYNIILKYDWVPPYYYTIRQKLLGKNSDNFFIAELQAEPWFTDGIENENPNLPDATFNVQRLIENAAYAKHVGASRAYMWGTEWWYFMKSKQKDPSYWNAAKEILK